MATNDNRTAGETEAAKEPEEEAPKELTLAEWKALSQRRSQPKYNLRKPNEGVDGAQFKKTYLLQKKKDEEESEYEEIEVVSSRSSPSSSLPAIQFNESKAGTACVSCAQCTQTMARIRLMLLTRDESICCLGTQVSDMLSASFQITEAKESKKKVLDIEINFNEPFRGGDDRRGGRGGGRGGRGGGGFRGEGRGGGLSGDDRRKRPPVAPGAGSRKQTAPKVDDVNDFPSLGVAA